MTSARHDRRRDRRVADRPDYHTPYRWPRLALLVVTLATLAALALLAWVQLRPR